MIDIYSKADYPACELSNFAVHPFSMDGVEIQSMEGFLQSLKYMNLSKQKLICKMSGKEAKQQGRRKFLWRIGQVVYWQGKEIDLLSDEYQILIDRAYDALYEQSVGFRQRRFATLEKGYELISSIWQKSVALSIQRILLKTLIVSFGKEPKQKQSFKQTMLFFSCI